MRTIVCDVRLLNDESIEELSLKGARVMRLLEACDNENRSALQESEEFFERVRELSASKQRAVFEGVEGILLEQRRKLLALDKFC